MEIEQINTFRLEYPDKSLKMKRAHTFHTTATKSEIEEILEHLGTIPYSVLENNLKRSGFYCKEIQKDLEK